MKLSICAAVGCQEVAQKVHSSTMDATWHPLCQAHGEGYLTLLETWQRGDRQPVRDVLERLEHVRA